MFSWSYSGYIFILSIRDWKVCKFFFMWIQTLDISILGFTDLLYNGPQTPL